MRNYVDRYIIIGENDCDRSIKVNNSTFIGCTCILNAIVLVYITIFIILNFLVVILVNRFYFASSIPVQFNIKLAAMLSRTFMEDYEARIVLK